MDELTITYEYVLAIHTGNTPIWKMQQATQRYPLYPLAHTPTATAPPQPQSVPTHDTSTTPLRHLGIVAAP